ncbi:Tat pathway signal sequence domain protein [Kitasatospora sp. NPDC004615]|uniref:Tat pathway signal sequence domain protein n=1 Tax=Kitasatospora sp. NPDC004615 TaxID=3364017 RepID=UPI0036AB2398
MRNRLFAAALAATTALIALLALPAGTASAAPKTPALPAVGNPLSADLVPGTVVTMYSPGTTSGFKCTASHLGGTLAADPNAPGTLSGPVDTLTFGGCTTNIPGFVSVTSLTMDNLPYTLAVSDAPSNPLVFLPTSAGYLQATLVTRTLAGNLTCVFRANVLNGNATNNLTQLNLSAQNLTKAAGPSLCFSSIDFSASYGPVTQGATGLVN